MTQEASSNPKAQATETSNSRRNQSNASDKNLRGLRGWLYLVAIGLVATIAFSLLGVIESLGLISDGTLFQLADTTSESYAPGFAALVYVEMIVELLFLGFGIYLATLFTKRSKLFPNLYITFLGLVVFWAVFDYFALASISAAGYLVDPIQTALEERGGEIGRSIIMGIVWIAYMRLSKRVKLTFVEEW
jgi:hypothetical protein